MKQQVEEMFQEEKPYLNLLPLTGFRYFRQETRRVQDDGMIQVGQSYYSALPAPLHQEIIVRIYEHEIEIIGPAAGIVSGDWHLYPIPVSIAFVPLRDANARVDYAAHYEALSVLEL